MILAAEIAMAVVVAGLAALALARFGRAFARFRGALLVACPETGAPAAAHLAVWRAAFSAIFRRPALRLRDCSLWRGGGPCGQPCLIQIEAAPAECLVRTILARWYEDKFCTCCGRPVGRIHWQRKPCFMGPRQTLREWKDVPVEDLPFILMTHQPVCWDCLVAETHVW